MSDRELLELAAKAAGEDVEWHETGSYFYRKSCNWPAEKGFFNPLHDDGEALRLAVRLGLLVNVASEDEWVEVKCAGDDRVQEDLEGVDHCAATRRAIVRAAAAIGESMP